MSMMGSPEAVHAREMRAIAANLLMNGSTNPEVLADYERWLAVSRLLGDVSAEDAEASMARAKNVLAANADHTPRFGKMTTPPPPPLMPHWPGMHRKPPP